MDSSQTLMGPVGCEKNLTQILFLPRKYNIDPAVSINILDLNSRIKIGPVSFFYFKIRSF
jgi:hypothetical protein